MLLLHKTMDSSWTIHEFLLTIGKDQSTLNSPLAFYINHSISWESMLRSAAAAVAALWRRCAPSEAQSPKCSVIHITVTPIWKWEFENKEHPIRVLYLTFLENFLSYFRSHIRDSKWGRKCIFINCTSCNGSPQQIPLQFANGKLPHSRCRAFWAKWL